MAGRGVQDLTDILSAVGRVVPSITYGDIVNATAALIAHGKLLPQSVSQRIPESVRVEAASQIILATVARNPGITKRELREQLRQRVPVGNAQFASMVRTHVANEQIEVRVGPHNRQTLYPLRREAE
jgi:predicted HTH transcriptional regulator